MDMFWNLGRRDKIHIQFLVGFLLGFGHSEHQVGMKDVLKLMLQKEFMVICICFMWAGIGSIGEILFYWCRIFRFYHQRV
jgi:hypothetical protein